MRDKPWIAYVIIVVAFTLGIWRVEANRADDDARARRAAAETAVDGCQAVQHANQLQDILIEIFATGTRATDPRVEAYIAAVRAVQADTRLCDLAARRVGHPIRPFPLPTSTTTTSKENP